MNEKNLKPFNKLTVREQRAIQRAGGRASVKVRRQKSLVRDALNRVLNMDLQTDKLPDAVKKVFNTMDPSLSVADAIGCGLAAKAMTGNPFAAQVLFDYSGNKLAAPKEEQEPDAVIHHTYIDCPQVLMGPSFYQLYEQVARHDYTFYTCAGGRGSLKSSFISLAIVKGVTKNPKHWAVIFRRYTNDLRDSVYKQIKWAITELGVENDFEEKLSPLRFIYKPTAQEIQFRGLDKPLKTKSMKSETGYFAYIWFEELNELSGRDAVRKVLQSVMRGGDKFWVFKSFNPPESRNQWANYDAAHPRTNEIVHRSNYLTAPPSWIGQPFIEEAEYQKEHNPRVYENEYMGIATGTGGEVFSNIIIRNITDDEIKTFDHQHRGVDWGQAASPMVYVAMHYDKHRRTLYIYYEYYKVGASIRQLAEAINTENVFNQEVRCDKAEDRSTKELHNDFDVNAVNARKGPGSRERGMRFLAKDVTHIVIDEKRCPNTAREFLTYALDKDKDGNYKAGYPDRDDHSIDATRYAMENEMDNVKNTRSTKVDLGG